MTDAVDDAGGEGDHSGNAHEPLTFPDADDDVRDPTSKADERRDDGEDE